MKIDKDYLIGFYDYNNVFFHVFNSRRPDESYSYSLASGEDYYVIRVFNEDRPYDEFRITPKTARYFASLQ